MCGLSSPTEILETNFVYTVPSVAENGVQFNPITGMSSQQIHDFDTDTFGMLIREDG